MYLRSKATFVPLCLLAAAGACQAEASPYYIGASQAFTHDSNVYREPSTASVASDTISTTSLLGGIDQPFGRQRLFADGTFRKNKYNEESTLDHDSYAANVGIDWSTIERWSGTVSANASQSLANLNPDDAATLGRRANIENAWGVNALARVGLVTALSGNFSVSYRNIDYSDESFASRELRQTAYSVGTTYRFSGLLTAGVAYRQTEGEYPNYFPAADEFTRRDIDFTGTWTPNAISRVSGRISTSDVSHSLDSQRDFTGLTGAVTWDWKPTGKLRFVTSLTHDTGDEAGFVALVGVPVQLALDSSRVTTTLQLKATWDATAKIAVDATARYADRDLVETTDGVSERNGNDRSKGLSLGVRWTPLRTLTLGCTASRDTRDSDEVLSSSYSADTIGCYGRVLLDF